jgi:hypothetical protein
MSTVVESTLVAERSEASSVTRTEWCLRIGAAACFIGHGAFGILTKESWVAYFGVVGLSRELAYTLMPIIGTVDIVAGIIVLISPRPIVLWYMAGWALWTATLRPLAGETLFETLERAGNYGVPIALLVLFGARPELRGLFDRVQRIEGADRATAGRVLQWTTATLLFAHGALQAITRKPSFGAHYAAVDVPASIAPVIGSVEMIAALAVMVAPIPALLLAVAAWKLATEALFPLSGAPIWEFVERGGSYAAPIALVLLAGKTPFTPITFSRSFR